MIRLRIPRRRRQSKLAKLKRESDDQHILRVPKARRICWILCLLWLFAMTVTVFLLMTGLWIPGRAG